MTYDRYYYSILPDEEKKLYKALYEGFTSFSEKIRIPAVGVSNDRIRSIIEYIGLDNPHIFYIDMDSISTIHSVAGTMVNVAYLYSPEESRQLGAKLHTILEKMLSRVSGRTDYEKELSVHDLIAKHVIYDDAALNNLTKYYSRSNTILGVMLYKTATCGGIASTTKMLLNMLDIKCIVAVGTDCWENVPHAWNIVKIDGQAYHLDVTWDMCVSREDGLRYDYFNLTDREIRRDHTWDIKYPPCVFEQYNYFNQNDLVVDSIQAALQRIQKVWGCGNSCISLKLSNTIYQDTATFADSIMTAAIRSGIVNNGCGYSVNEAQRILTIFQKCGENSNR